MGRRTLRLILAGFGLAGVVSGAVIIHHSLNSWDEIEKRPAYKQFLDTGKELRRTENTPLITLLNC